MGEKYCIKKKKSKSDVSTSEENVIEVSAPSMKEVKKLYDYVVEDKS